MSEATEWKDFARVAVIVVNYRTPDLTITCAESILASAGTQPHVFIVDNDSGDDSVARCTARFGDVPDVTIIARTTNDGYAGGNNAGVALATSIGARYALILNSDTVLDRDCLRRLVDAAERDARVVLVTPRILHGDEPERVWFGGARFSLWLGRPTHIERSDAGARDLAFASGCALLVRLDAVRAGASELFDATLFSYAEDLDLSLRVRNAGGRIQYVPEGTVWHYVGSSHRRAGGQALRFYLSTRNLLRVVGRHAHWYHWITLGPMLAIDVVGRFALVALRDRDVSAFAAVFRGAWHAIAGGTHPIERPRRQ